MTDEEPRRCDDCDAPVDWPSIWTLTIPACDDLHFCGPHCIRAFLALEPS